MFRQIDQANSVNPDQTVSRRGLIRFTLFAVPSLSFTWGQLSKIFGVKLRLFSYPSV